MALKFKCPNCNEKIVTKFLEAGDIVECKKCGRMYEPTTRRPGFCKKCRPHAWLNKLLALQNKTSTPKHKHPRKSSDSPTIKKNMKYEDMLK